MSECAKSSAALHFVQIVNCQKDIQYFLAFLHFEKLLILISLCFSEVRPGRCPSGTPGSQQSCDGDSECPGGEKCCESKCTTPTSIGE